MLRNLARMARTTRAATNASSHATRQKDAAPQTVKRGRGGRAAASAVKKQESNTDMDTDPDVKQEESTAAAATATAPRSKKRKCDATSKRAAAPSSAMRQSKRVKTEDDSDKKTGILSPSPTESESEFEAASASPSMSPSPSPSASASASPPPSSKKKTPTKKTSTKKASSKNPKQESEDTKSTTTTTPKKSKKPSDPKDLSSKKLKAYFAHANTSPFPDFPHPTAEEAKLAHRILASLHGERNRPETVVASKTSAGCGDSPSVLDALVRTILSQNTSDKNSTRAKQNMDRVYGGSDHWEEILEGGQAKLQEAIKSGGLSVTKSKVIISIIQQAKEKYGVYSLDHLFKASDEEAMREMLSFQGVGPKTASCVLLFCLQRESFAVDTHVQRITGLLGWHPKSSSREETHSHLDVMIPDEDKYGLHILLVKHGKVCDECKAGGKSVGKCELRQAFRQGKVKGEAGDEVKEEEIDQIKKEKKEDDDDGEEWYGV